jgi:hypothetical protein
MSKLTDFLHRRTPAPELLIEGEEGHAWWVTRDELTIVVDPQRPANPPLPHVVVNASPRSRRIPL